MGQINTPKEFVKQTKAYHQKLFGVAYALCRDKDQAADLAQETLIKAYKARDRYQSDRPIYPWLKTILHNIFRDSFKTAVAKHEVKTDTELHLSLLESKGPSPLEHIEKKELSKILREEMCALDDEHQQILELCVVQGCSFSEAAELLNLPLGTVSSRLARARAKMRQRLLDRKQELRENLSFLDVNESQTRTASRAMKTKTEKRS